MFSIKAHFLIWSYQACNNSYKLVTCIATNLVLDKIKLLKIKSFHLSIIYTFKSTFYRPANWRHQFNLYKTTFSIKAHFLIWSYEASNNDKLVIENLVLGPKCIGQNITKFGKITHCALLLTIASSCMNWFSTSIFFSSASINAKLSSATGPKSSSPSIKGFDPK